ncbi:antifungal protein [Astrocystis sublimbata]|nr:antifungal protein [Astrocystis sublimbata]
MQIINAALFLFAAMGAVATPLEAGSDGLDARGADAVLITYKGKCTKSSNTCKYTGQNGKTTIVSCPTARNLVCTNDNKECTFDSVDKKVTCS